MDRGTVLALALIVAGCSGLTNAQQARYENLKVEQARGRYETATDNLGRCVAAKLVAVAYADAEAETDAQAWRARERVDCQAAYAELETAAELGEPADGAQDAR